MNCIYTFALLQYTNRNLNFSGKMNRSKQYYLIILFLTLPFFTLAQTDTLEFNNGEMVIGEIKSLSRGVIAIETAYSDSDFKIEWTAVTRIRSQQRFLTYLQDGRRLYATVNSTEGRTAVLIDGANIFTVQLIEIVDLKPIDDSFWDRVSASASAGVNITKANNLKQFNAMISLGYLTQKWKVSGSYNDVYSRQDSVEQTRRMDANVNLTIFLVKDWFVGVSNGFLQNDEQKLALRSTTKAGIGNYLVNTNTLYLSIFAGSHSIMKLLLKTLILTDNPVKHSSD
jgi:hypothetical protein